MKRSASEPGLSHPNESNERCLKKKKNDPGDFVISAFRFVHCIEIHRLLPLSRENGRGWCR